MNGTKLAKIAIVAVLLISLLALPLVQACSKPATTPSPAPAAPATPAPKPAASPTATAKAPTTVQIGILGMSTGAGWYVVSGGLAKLISDNSPWLKAQLVETTGAAENFRVLQDQPETRKTRLATGGIGTMLEAAAGKPPYKIARSTPVVAGFLLSNLVIVTLDPNIKTPKDLNGKTIITNPAGSVFASMMDALVETWGLTGVKRVYGGFDKCTAALLDGTASATVLAIGGYPWGTNPSTEQLLASNKTVYAIPVTQADIDFTNKRQSWGMFLATIAKGTLNKQTVDWPGMCSWNAVFADQEMDPAIVYEITRIAYEHYKEIQTFNAIVAGFQPSYMSAVGDSSIYHPGAAKFYNEKGLKMALKTSF